MIGWRDATALMSVVALLLDAHTGVWAQGSNEGTDTFEQRFMPDQVPTPPSGQQPPRQPSICEAPTQPPADQRSPPDQVLMPPSGEQTPRQPPVGQAPTQPPAEQLHATPNPIRPTGQNPSPGGEQPKKLGTVSTARRVAGARRSRSRVVVAPRSFLDAGTEVLPGDRKFLDYALGPLHTPTDVITNTGGRVGWHTSPLPGPLFPGRGPW